MSVNGCRQRDVFFIHQQAFEMTLNSFFSSLQCFLDSFTSGETTWKIWDRHAVVGVGIFMDNYWILHLITSCPNA